MKKIISILVIISCLLPHVIVAEAAETLVASATLDATTATTSGMSVSTGSYSSTPIINSSYGRNAWTLGSTTTVNDATVYQNQNIYLDINESAISATDRDNYRMEITYYDYETWESYDNLRYRGRLFVSYYNYVTGRIDMLSVISKGEGAWKTASIDIVGAKLGNMLSNCDMMISTQPTTYWAYSSTPMYVSNVKIYKTGTSNASVVFNTTDEALNFFAGETQQIEYTVTAQHGLNSRVEYSQTYSVVDEDGNTLWTAAGTTFKSSNGGVKKYTVDLDIKKYGIHNFIIEIRDDQGGYTKASVEFAVLKKNENPKLNKKLGVSAHFSNNIGTSTLHLYAQMGNGIVRDEVLWKDYEVNGAYAIPERHLNWINTMVDSGVEIMALLGTGHVDHTGSESTIPTGDALDAFGQYVYNVVSDLKGKVKYFEILNETNIGGDITSEAMRKQRGREYAEILKVAYTQAKAANPDCKIIAFASAGWSGSFHEGVVEQEPNISNYFDIMSHHQYAQGSYAETMRNAHGIYWIEDQLRSIDSDAPIWITETGHAALSYGRTEREAAMWNVRQYILNDYEPIYEKTIHYTWIDHHDTNYKWDSTLGVLNNDSRVKRDYIAYAAMNSFLATAKFQDRVVDANDNYTYRYTEGNTEIKVIFNEFDEKQSISVTPKYKYTKLFDMYGNEISMSGNTITIDGAPRYFVSSTEPIVSDGATMVYQTNEAVIKGSITGAQAGAQIMIYALKPGYTGSQILTTPSAYAYIDQVTVGENGTYQFSFPMNGEEGVYNVYVGYAGSDTLLGPTTLDVSRDVTATTSLYAGTTKITTLSQLGSVDGDTLTVKGNIDNRYNVKLDAMLYAAGYKDGKLLWANVLPGTPNIVGDNEMSFDINKSDAVKADEIKILLWKDNFSPLTNDVTPIQ